MTAPKDLRVGVHPGSQSLFLLHQTQPDIGSAEGHVRWVPFERALHLPDLLRDGVIEVAGSGSLPFLRALAEGQDLVFIATTAPRPGFNRLFTRRDSGIIRFSDLRGRRVGLMRGSWIEHLLAVAADAAGFAPTEIELVDGREGVDAWMAVGAELVMAERNSELRPVDDFTDDLAKRGLWRGNRSLIVVRRDALREKAPVLRRLLAGLSASDAAVAHDAAPAAALFAAGHPGGADASLWQEAFERLPWGLAAPDAAFVAEFQHGAGVLHRAGLLPALPDIARASQHEAGPLFGAA